MLNYGVKVRGQRGVRMRERWMVSQSGSVSCIYYGDTGRPFGAYVSSKTFFFWWMNDVAVMEQIGDSVHDDEEGQHVMIWDW